MNLGPAHVLASMLRAKEVSFPKIFCANVCKYYSDFPVAQCNLGKKCACTVGVPKLTIKKQYLQPR